MHIGYHVEGMQVPYIVCNKFIIVYHIFLESGHRIDYQRVDLNSVFPIWEGQHMTSSSARTSNTVSSNRYSISNSVKKESHSLTLR